MNLTNSEDFDAFLNHKNSIKHYKMIEFYAPRLVNCVTVSLYIISFTIHKT